ncbi:MAG TPA: hypothetical protein VKE49_12825 [Myxococcaceae bacterium]|nr:hypothetical protein [Myxococcaceae bacterium]
MGSRWEALLEQKPVTLTEHLIEETSKRLSKELAEWPLPIRDFDPQTGQSFEPLLRASHPRPSDAVFQQSFRLASWDVQREFAAYDDYVRNRRWMDAGLTTTDKPALLFISRWLVEQVLQIAEGTGGQVTRAQLVDCLERAARRLGRKVL